MKNIIGIIPARGGSKGILRKNIRDLNGHPLIAFSIAAGLQSKAITRLIVSTEDPEIAAVARDYGAEVPFMRPHFLAQDDTLDLRVFQYTLNRLFEEERYLPSAVVHLRPTSPLRPPGLVDDAIKILFENRCADSVRGIIPADKKVFKTWTINSNNTLRPLVRVKGIEESYNASRQMLPDPYWHTGIIDVVRSEVILQKESMSGDIILPIHVPFNFSVDIDTLADWIKCEKLMLDKELNIIHPR